MALADLNPGGFPDVRQLKDMSQNDATFMTFLTRQMKSGAMLGLGSAESPGGDSDINDMGIVMNHAYAIL